MRIHWLFAALAVLALQSPAHSRIVTIGEIEDSGARGLGSAFLRGSFDDHYLFSIGPDDAFEFSALASTPLSNRFWITDFTASLFRGDQLLGTFPAVDASSPEGFSSVRIDVPSIFLGTGSYDFVLTGIGGGANSGLSGEYTGSMAFVRTVASVPEPGTLGLLLVGAGLAVVLRRKRDATIIGRTL